MDGLRFVAITAVVLYHLEDYLVAKSGWSRAEVGDLWLHRVLHVGNIGVQLFFTISGFILALPFAQALCGLSREPLPSLKHYYWRRLTRLEPPYLINLLLGFVLLIVVTGQDAGELVPHLGASLVYLHNQVYGQMSAVNGVAWSLEIEVQFYLIAPLLAIFLFRQPRLTRRVVMAGLMAAAILWKITAPPTDPRVILSLLGTFEHFLAGMLLADVYANDWAGQPRRSLWWDLVSLAVWPALVWTQWSNTTAPLLPLLSFVAYMAALRGNVNHRLLTLGPIVVVGGMCYTMYLYHFWIVSFIGTWSLSLTTGDPYFRSLGVQALIVLPGVVVASAVLFKLFEQPFMRWQPWRRPDSAASPGALAPIPS